MRSFLVLCFAVAAFAAPQGYNYQQSAPAYHQQQQVAHAPAQIGYSAQAPAAYSAPAPAPAAYAAPAQAAPATSYSGATSQSYGAAQAQSYGGASAQSYDTASAQSYGAGSAQSYGSAQGGQAQSFGAASHAGQASNFGQAGIATTQQQTIVTKNFYIHSAPEEQEDEASSQQLGGGPAHKNYRVVFIKAPSQTSGAAALSLAQAQSEEKTVIYVLSKKTSAADLQSEIAEAKNAAEKPEVFFIKYKTQEEAQHAQQQIQAQYDSLGGTSEISDEGIAPVQSFIGALGDSGAASSAGHAHAGGASFGNDASLGGVSSIGGGIAAHDAGISPGGSGAHGVSSSHIGGAPSPQGYLPPAY